MPFFAAINRSIRRRPTFLPALQQDLVYTRTPIGLPAQRMRLADLNQQRLVLNRALTARAFPPGVIDHWNSTSYNAHIVVTEIPFFDVVVDEREDIAFRLEVKLRSLFLKGHAPLLARS